VALKDDIFISLREPNKISVFSEQMKFNFP